LSDPAERSAFLIEPLSSRHDRAAFSCGIESLDFYLVRQASQDFRRRVSVTFVLTPDGKTIAGYYTLSQYAVQLYDVPEGIARKLPKYPMVPATLIGRLAVSTAFRGQGHGEMLLMDALHRVLAHSREVASAAAIVDAVDESANAFYRKYGFLELPKVPRRLFLPIGTIEKIFA
jgi:ribosomal protein S18 acetylase RimI-like enzyme